MQAFMMYMSGSSLQIFSITMTLMLFSNPIKALIGMPAIFGQFTTPKNKGNMLAYKFVYIALQFCFVALGIWKCNQMGILPTTRSDWLAWETAPEYKRIPFAM
jgi:hypothetical protein